MIMLTPYFMTFQNLRNFFSDSESASKSSSEHFNIKKKILKKNIYTKIFFYKWGPLHKKKSNKLKLKKIIKIDRQISY